MELLAYQAEMLQVRTSTGTEVARWHIKLAFRTMQIWAKRGLCIVRNSKDARAYEAWLESYVEAWLRDSRRYLTKIIEPHLVEPTLVELHTQLIRAQRHWTANAIAQVLTNEAKQMKPADEVIVATPASASSTPSHLTEEASAQQRHNDTPEIQPPARSGILEEWGKKTAALTSMPSPAGDAPAAPSGPPETQPSPPREPVAEPQGPSPTPPDVSETPSGPPDVSPDGSPPNPPPASGTLAVTHETVPARTKQRRTSTITSLIAAQRMEAYMNSKGLDFEEFGSIVGAAGKTLRSFANTGIIQRRIAKNVAIAMGTTLEELLKSD
jgi:hypothetical protein